MYRSMVLTGRAVFRALDLDRVVLHPERLPFGGAVLAITHFGYLDFALAEWAVWQRSGRQVRFLVTARAFEYPVAGRLLRAMRHVPVERRAGAQAYAAAVVALRAGELVGIFPEGQVNQGDVGPLKTGAVRMAARAGVPLVPVVVCGGDRVLTKGQRFSLRRARHSRIVISFGEPVHPGDGPAGALDPQQATARLREVLQAMLREADAGTG